MAGFLGSVFGFGDTPSSGQIDPRLKQLQQEQAKAAEDYRASLPGVKQQKFDLSKDQARQDLAQQMAGIKSNMSHRGMLYGGQMAGAASGAYQDMSSRLAQNRAEINAQTEGQASQMANQAISSGLQLQQMQQDIYDREFQQAMNQRQMRADIAGGLIEGGAKIGRMFAGGM